MSENMFDRVQRAMTEELARQIGASVIAAPNSVVHYSTPETEMKKHHIDLTAIAIVAITEMRSPSGDMWKAGRAALQAGYPHPTVGWATDIWHAMIDVALEPTKSNDLQS